MSPSHRRHARATGDQSRRPGPPPWPVAAHPRGDHAGGPSAPTGFPLQSDSCSDRILRGRHCCTRRAQRSAPTHVRLGSLGCVVRSVYIASLTGETGKSTVALGVTESLTRRIGRVGVFRPIVRSGHDRDYVLDLLLDHDGVDLPYEMCAGVTYEDVHADADAAMATIMDRFHVVAAQCEAVVVVGSDYTDVGSPTEFSFNARIAANLGAPVMVVVNARGRQPDDVRTIAELAAHEVAANYGTTLALVANRTDPHLVDSVRDALDDTVEGVVGFALPEEPILSAPTVADLLRESGGAVYSGHDDALSREVLNIVVAGMTLPHILDRLTEDAVVITPSDRSDVLVGLLTAHTSATFPRLAGVV